jgi:hypothetical protein
MKSAVKTAATKVTVTRKRIVERALRFIERHIPTGETDRLPTPLDMYHIGGAIHTVTEPNAGRNIE